MDAGAEPTFARPGAAEPIVAIALGSGGARGFAHIAVLEALDELGVTPAAIAGTSIGAMIGAAYAAGMSGRDIRAYVLGALRNRGEVMGKLLRAGSGASLISSCTGAAIRCCSTARSASTSSGRPQCQTFSSSSPNRCWSWRPISMIAASSSSRAARSDRRSPVHGDPGLIQPVAYDGRYLIDGGAVNPLPMTCYLITPTSSSRSTSPSAAAGAKRAVPLRFSRCSAPRRSCRRGHGAEVETAIADILVRPGVEQFGVLDFLRVGQILRAAESAKDELKRLLSARFEATLGD